MVKWFIQGDKHVYTRRQISLPYTLHLICTVYTYILHEYTYSICFLDSSSQEGSTQHIITHVREDGPVGKQGQLQEGDEILQVTVMCCRSHTHPCCKGKVM